MTICDLFGDSRNSSIDGGEITTHGMICFTCSNLVNSSSSIIP